MLHGSASSAHPPCARVEERCTAASVRPPRGASTVSGSTSRQIPGSTKRKADSVFFFCKRSFDEDQIGGEHRYKRHPTMPKRKMKVEQPDTEDSTRWRHEERSGCAHLVAESARRTCAVAARTVRCFIIVVKSVVHRKCEGGVVALRC